MATRAGCGRCSVRLCSWRFMSCCCTCLPSSPTSATAPAPPAPAAAAAAFSTTSTALLPQITLEQLEALIPILELEVKRLDPTTASSSSSQAPPVSESLKNMLAQWEGQKQMCISFVESIPKQLTDEVVETSTSLFMSILTNALSGAGGLQWLGVGFTFIAWSLDNISNIIQNRVDCIEILRQSFRLLRHTKEIWQATNIGNTTRNEDLQDSVEKAFRCAIFCTSTLTDNWLLRILKATTVKDEITMFADELDRANIQNIEFMLRHGLTNKLERQITYRISNDGIVGGQDVIQEAVTYLSTSADDIMAICLHGMGGIGKSFLGLEIFAQFQKSKYRDCRVELQLETKQGEDLCGIQKQILEKVCKRDTFKFSNLTDGKQIMQKELEKINDPIFLYVDNVPEYRLVTDLLPKASFFPKGSRILITSRGGYIGRGIEDLGITDYRLIEVRKLQREQAQQLLWEQLKSKGEHRDISEVESLEDRVLELCDGLPLALTIVGKYIAYDKGRKKVEIWRQVVDDMQNAEPFVDSKNDELYSRLMFSIHNLDPNVKAAFLDITFLLHCPGVYLITWEIVERLVVSNKYLEMLCQRALVQKNSVIAGFSLRWRVVEIHDVLKAMGKRMVENDQQELRITGMDKFEELHHNALKNVVALDHVTVDAHLLKQMPLLRLLKDVDVRGEGQDLIQLRHLRVALGLRCSTSRAFDWSKCGSLKEVAWGQLWEERLEKDEAAPAPNVSNLQEVFEQDKISMRFEALTLYDWSQLKDVDLIETLTCLKELQLPNCREIESLPEGIARLTGLKLLDLSGCKKLKGLPQGISSLRCLEVLDLHDCERVQSLPEGISRLTGLNQLDLGGCKKLKGLPQGISSLKCLEVLRLKDCESIQSLPEGISKLTGLNQLDLWGCKRLKGLPQGISSLRCLEVLNLADCESVESLPDGLMSLTDLRELYLCGCESLQSIPEAIGNLRKVNGFLLWGCKSLESIPEGAINLMSGSTQLSLSECYKVKYLPDGVTRLTGLKSLDLRQCRSLRSLPEGVSGLTGLTCLLLEGCKMLQAVPEGIASLSGLNEIDLSCCQALKSLPKGLSCLPCLTSLKLAGCRSLQALPEKLGFMTGFRKLDLRLCESLQFLPDEISKLTGLVHLDLYGCKSLQSIQGVTTLTALRILDLRNCTQLQLLPEGCTRLTSLRHIYLSGCTSLKSIPEATLGYLHRSPSEEEEEEEEEEEVNSLYLSGCESLKSLPQSIGSFTFLERLDLANCTSLESLPEGVTRLSNLAEFSLLGCKSLHCLPRGLIGSLTGLTELNLRDCALLIQPLLEEVSCNMTNLKVLILSGCEDLQSFPQGITSLMGLETLSLFKCKNFQLLPQGMANWTGLTRLVLSGCQSLQSVPEELITMTALSHLQLSKCAGLRSLPQRIFTSLGGLEQLSMSGCGGLQLEESHGITRLAGLRRLHLSESEHLLFLLSEQQGLSSLTCLKELYLSRCRSLRSLPEGVAALTYLDRVKLSGCASLQSLSNLPQGSTCLSQLHLGGCGSLDQPPVWERIMSFKCLKYLNLSGWETMQALPEGIASLESLTELDLSKCSSLLSLPESVMNLTNLEMLGLEDCKSLQSLRPEITRLVRLNGLDLSGCTSLEPLPEEITLWISGMWRYRPCLHESSPQ